MFPLKCISIDPIFKYDCSARTNSTITNNETPQWQDFLAHFDRILSAYGLRFNSSIHKKGLSDLSMWAGWTCNYQQTEYLDFIDFTIKMGALVPTGACRNEDLLFDLPLGYNGHSGFQIAGNLALGLYEWLTLGGHAHALTFSDKHQHIRVKTSPEQSGLIKLAKLRACVHQGLVWECGVFIKADHLPDPVSLLIGYTFSQKKRDLISSCSSSTILPEVINTDATLFGWRMHTLHIAVEYDFTQQDRFIGPRLTFILNRPLSGKNILNTQMLGLNGGIDLSWRF